MFDGLAIWSYMGLRWHVRVADVLNVPSVAKLTLLLTSVTLSSTLFTPSSTQCVTFRTCAVAIRASSCVNLSSLLNASSISLLPISFFRYFSEFMSVTRNAPQGISSLARPCFISFVTIPKIPSTSTMIFTMISFIASVVGTSVYSSSRLKKFSIRSKISMSVSWLAIKSFAACVGSVSEPPEKGRSRTITTERRIPAPAKMTFAGANTYEYVVRGGIVE